MAALQSIVESRLILSTYQDMQVEQISENVLWRVYLHVFFCFDRSLQRNRDMRQTQR